MVDFTTEWLLNESVTARYLSDSGIPFRVAWNRSGKGVVACSDVASERGIDESNVAKTVVAVARGKSEEPPVWIVSVVRGDDLVDWKKLKRLMKPVIGKRDPKAVPAEDLLDFGIPVGAIAPPQFLGLPIPIHFAVDDGLLSPKPNSNDSFVDFSSGLRLVGLQLPVDSVNHFFECLDARTGSFARKSVVSFPIALRELPEQQRVDAVELMALLALEDGDRCRAELNLISAVASRLAVTDSDLSAVLDDTDGHQPDDRSARAMQLIDSMKHLDGTGRNWLVFLSALLAHADDECDTQERDRIKAWAADLNVSPNDTHSLLLLGECVRHNELDTIRRLNAEITRQFSDVIQSVLNA